LKVCRSARKQSETYASNAKIADVKKEQTYYDTSYPLGAQSLSTIEKSFAFHMHPALKACALPIAVAISKLRMASWSRLGVFN
jgi:hypothetical protein